MDTDVERLCALSLSVWLDTYATEGISRPIAAHVLAEFSPESMAGVLGDPRRKVWVGERGEHLRGLIQVRLGGKTPWDPASEGLEIERLYVQERFRGEGLGRRLLSEAETFAVAQAESRTWLTAWVENKRALSFYEANGYLDRGETWIEFEGQRVLNRLLEKVLARDSLSG